MKFKVKTTRGKRPLVEVEFEEHKYALAGELLLAERPFLGEIIKALNKTLGDENSAAESFSGNAFTIYITRETTKISNDINGEEVQTPTKDLLKLTKAYQKQYGKLQH